MLDPSMNEEQSLPSRPSDPRKSFRDPTDSKKSNLRVDAAGPLKGSYFGVSSRLVSLFSLILVLGVWEIWGRQIDPLFASYPTRIAGRFWELLLSGELIPAFGESMKSLAAGYVLAVGVGVLIGLAIGSFRTVEAALNLYVWAGFSTPMIALVPLFILWFGLGFAAKVAIVFTMAVFPIIINTADGVRSVPGAWVEVGKGFAANQATIVRSIVLPASLPAIMTGLRIGIGRGIIGMVVAEFFTAISGLGAIIIKAGYAFQTDRMFVPIIILMALGWGLTSSMRYLERLVAPWHAEFTGRHNR